MAEERDNKRVALVWGGRLLVACAFAAMLLWLVQPFLRMVPSSWTIEPWAIPVYLLMLVPYHLLRAGRWCLLLRPLGVQSWREPTTIGLAGFMWVAVLPFRLGEWGRVLFLAQRSAVSWPAAAAVVAVERVVDGLIVSTLFFVSASAMVVTSDNALVGRLALAVMLTFAVALVALTVFALFPRVWSHVVARLVMPISPRVADKLSAVVTELSRGLTGLPSPRTLVAFVSTSAVFWLVHAAGVWLLARGCGLPLAYMGAVQVLTAMNIVMMAPGGPAQLGTFQAGLAVGLSLVVSPTDAAAQGSTFALLLYACQMITIVFVGAWAQHRLRLDWRALFRRRSQSVSPSPVAPRADSDGLAPAANESPCSTRVA